jgi:hypothetical protein
MRFLRPLKWFAAALFEDDDRPEALLLAVEKLIAVCSKAQKPEMRGTVRTSEALSA